MYKFIQDVHSLATGKLYRKGQTVPPGFRVSQEMIDKGVIEEIKVTKEVKKAKPAKKAKKVPEKKETPVKKNLTKDEMEEIEKVDKAIKE